MPGNKIGIHNFAFQASVMNVSVYKGKTKNGVLDPFLFYLIQQVEGT